MAKTRDSSPILSRCGTPVGEPVTARTRKLDVTAAKIQVNEAEAQLQHARELLKAAEAAEATRQLAQVRASLSLQQDQLVHMTTEINQGRGESERLRVILVTLSNQIAEHESTRPAVADVLPGDPAVKVWAREYSRLKAQQAQTLQARKNISMPDTLALVKLDEAIKRLRGEEANLLRKINGEVKQWQGTLSYV